MAGDWILTDTQFTPVKVPTHDSITGDKLTAFAPNTTGIRYKQGKELEIVKQLFDLGWLYHEVKNTGTVKAAFDRIVEKEIVYRGRTCEREDVLNEAITASARAALMAAKIKCNGAGSVSTFQPGMDKRAMLIENKEYNFLNKLPAEALFYWNATLRVLSEQS